MNRFSGMFPFCSGLRMDTREEEVPRRGTLHRFRALDLVTRSSVREWKFDGPMAVGALLQLSSQGALCSLHRVMTHTVQHSFYFCACSLPCCCCLVTFLWRGSPLLLFLGRFFSEPISGPSASVWFGRHDTEWNGQPRTATAFPKVGNPQRREQPRKRALLLCHGPSWYPPSKHTRDTSLRLTDESELGLLFSGSEYPYK